MKITVGTRVEARIENGNFFGVIHEIRERGPIMASPQRTHYVKLDRPFMEFSGMWFDPNDLVIDDNK